MPTGTEKAQLSQDQLERLQRQAEEAGFVIRKKNVAEIEGQKFSNAETALNEPTNPGQLTESNGTTEIIPAELRRQNPALAQSVEKDGELLSRDVINDILADRGVEALKDFGVDNPKSVNKLASAMFGPESKNN